MTFDWSQYLKLARQLAGYAGTEDDPCNDEGKFRAAISRAYYAAHISARNFIIDKDGSAPDSQRDLHEKFKQGPKSEKKIGRQLEQMKKSRLKADYEDTFDGLVWERNRVIKLATRVLEALGGL